MFKYKQKCLKLFNFNFMYCIFLKNRNYLTDTNEDISKVHAHI